MVKLPSLDSVFHDREAELRYLQDRHEGLKRGELIVLFGRRRLGKTALVQKFLKGASTPRLYLFVNILEPVELLRSFSEDIREQLGENITFRDWAQFLEWVEQKAERPFVLVFDEFQRFRDIAPDFITRLQHAWDRRLKDRPLLLLLVGSSIGMMRKIALDARGPLYGRKTGQLQLAPFRYSDFRTVFPNLSEEQRVTFYGVFGGTPLYALQIKSDDLFKEIREHILLKTASLREEPKDILQFELRVTARYNAILTAIALGKVSVGHISDFIQVRREGLPGYLDTLDRLLNLVEREEPVLGKKMQGRYRFADPFFRFWYRFVFPENSALELENYETVEAKIRDQLPAYLGPVFEDVCRELLTRYNGHDLEGLPLNLTKLGRWWSRKAERETAATTPGEIDLVGINGKRLLLGEAKWTNDPVDAGVLNRLIHEKAPLLQWYGPTDYMLFSKSGFTESCKRLAEQTSTRLFDLSTMARLFDHAPKTKTP
jgi:hypothetical protein